jgi:putative hydrolase of the HAD superfamily
VPTSDQPRSSDRSETRREAIAGVLFDATGTLIETRESVGQVYAGMSREFGVDLPAWRLDDAFRRVLKRAGPRALDDAGDQDARDRDGWRAIVRSTFLAADSTVAFSDFDLFFDRLFDHYAGSKAWCLREGCVELLRGLRDRSLQLGIVSNFDHRLIDILEQLEIASFFNSIVIPSRCGFQKPAPEIFEAALRELGLPARATVYVGDDPEKDLAAARAMGMRTVDARSLESLEELQAQLDTLAADEGAPEEMIP